MTDDWEKVKWPMTEKTADECQTGSNNNNGSPSSVAEMANNGPCNVWIQIQIQIHNNDYENNDLKLL